MADIKRVLSTIVAMIEPIIGKGSGSGSFLFVLPLMSLASPFPLTRFLGIGLVADCVYLRWQQPTSLPQPNCTGYSNGLRHNRNHNCRSNQHIQLMPDRRPLPSLHRARLGRGGRASTHR